VSWYKQINKIEVGSTTLFFPEIFFSSGAFEQIGQGVIFLGQIRTGYLW